MTLASRLLPPRRRLALRAGFRKVRHTFTSGFGTPVAKRFDCLVFDFDGTIADTLQPAVRVFNTLAAKYGFRPLSSEDIQKVRDMSTAQFLKFARISRLKVPRLLLEGRQCIAAEMEQVKPVAGIVEVIEHLHRQVEVLGIVTSNSKQNVQKFLEHHKLHQFSFISTVPKLGGKHKHLKAVLKIFTLESDQVIYIGDEVRDIKAAQKAGLASCGVTWGFNSSKALREKKPTYLFEHPRELLHLPLKRG